MSNEMRTRFFIIYHDGSGVIMERINKWEVIIQNAF